MFLIPKGSIKFHKILVLFLLEKEAQRLSERLALEEAEAMEMEDEEIKAANMNIEKEVGKNDTPKIPYSSSMYSNVIMIKD